MVWLAEEGTNLYFTVVLQIYLYPLDYSRSVIIDFTLIVAFFYMYQYISKPNLLSFIYNLYPHILDWKCEVSHSVPSFVSIMIITSGLKLYIRVSIFVYFPLFTFSSIICLFLFLEFHSRLVGFHIRIEDFISCVI